MEGNKADNDRFVCIHVLHRKGGKEMRIPYRRMMEALRFLLLFVTCTLLSYGIIALLADKLLPSTPYDEPHGNAVKVVNLVNSPETQDLDGYLTRLQLFYVTGE
jgi:hypothetical protein